PVAAAGTVVDAAGDPVGRATVTPTVPLPRTVEGGATRLPKCWLVPVRTDARGRFEIRGEVGSDRVSLLAEKRGLAGDPVEVEAGARDARLVLEVAGEIEGTVLLDPSLLDSIVLAHAFRKTPEPSREVSSSEKPAVVARDGRFSLRGLESGSHSVHLVYAATGTEIGRVEDIPVREGETARDPRLDPLDLRGGFRLIDLELADERGAPIFQARAYSRRSGEANDRWTYARAEGGRLKLLRDERPLDVSITSPGFLRTELDRVTDSQRVALRRAASVRLELAGGLAVPEPPLFLGAALTPVQPGRFLGFVDSSEGTFDASGVLRCETPFLGDLRVELFVTRRDQGSAPRTYVEEEAPPIVSLADQGVEQVFTIRLDPARLEAAVRSVREAR
ncbi:MAG TPA: carboxypeptidase-like regulatory domain-containing protein, partial [Planctomycetota bacterium]|nr:carboxypeptidase-like regulatory domain-containing protein [Planctomycetota bacterium]